MKNAVINARMELELKSEVEAMQDALVGKNMETVSMEELISQARSRGQ